MSVQVSQKDQPRTNATEATNKQPRPRLKRAKSQEPRALRFCGASHCAYFAH